MTMKAPTRRPRPNKKEEENKITPSAKIETPVEENVNLNKKNIDKKIEDEIANAELKYEGPLFIFHEIECLCFSRAQKVLAHDGRGRVVDVFSLVDEKGKIIPSTVQCEDCGRKWDVLDLDDYDMAPIDKMPTYTRKMLQRNLSKDLFSLCEEWKVNTSTVAYINWIIENKKWGTEILINKMKYRREDIFYETRILVINGPLNFKIKEMKASDVAEFW